MAAVRIVTDSACDLPDDRAEQLGVQVVPLKIRFGEEEYVDREELSVSDFYKKLTTSDELPETAAPPPGAFEAAFRRAADEGADGVLCVDLSSELSATMQAAQNAAKAVADDIAVTVVDSCSITAGLGSQVEVLAEAAGGGADLSSLEALAHDLVGRTRVFGTLDTLEYLKKGGRIGGAQAFLGTMLSIKPCVDLSNGKVEEAGKQRTRRRALRWLADTVVQSGPVERLAVRHAEAGDVDVLVDMLGEHVPRDEISVGLIGAVIGTHGGPGTVGACWQVPAS
jgi:DegV family protein with EDD domain